MDYPNERRRVISVIGIIIGAIMAIVGLSLLISSNVEPGTALMEVYFDQYDHQKIQYDEDYYKYFSTDYVTVYMAHQITILCACFGWALLLSGAVCICYFSYKFNDDSNIPEYIPTKSIIKPLEDQVAAKAVQENGTTWVCGNCFTENSVNHGQCKKCGKFKG